MLNTIGDYVQAWKQGRYGEVLDSLQDHWEDKDIYPSKLKLLWFMRLGIELEHSLRGRQGYGSFDYFMSELDDLLTS